jgi:hypothetical protein
MASGTRERLHPVHGHRLSKLESQDLKMCTVITVELYEHPKMETQAML